MGGVTTCPVSANASRCWGAATRGGRVCPASSSYGVSGLECRHRRRLWRFKCLGTANGCGSSGDEAGDWVTSASASPYQVLGVDPDSCSPTQLKAAFRARALDALETSPLQCKDEEVLQAMLGKASKSYIEEEAKSAKEQLHKIDPYQAVQVVKEFHPDVCKDMKDANRLIKRVIKAYEILSRNHQDEPDIRPGTDPFEKPECEAYDLFINEFQCFGKGCPYSCVKVAPRTFAFSAENGTAHVISQGYGVDYYLVQLAVGQCPRRCIHYVTPAQREILEDLLQSALTAPFDIAEMAVLDSLVSKANFENNRYQKPKSKPKVSTEYVDWV